MLWSSRRRMGPHGPLPSCTDPDPPAPGPDPPAPDPTPGPVQTGDAGVKIQPTTHDLCPDGTCNIEAIKRDQIGNVPNGRVAWALLAAYYKIPLIGIITTQLDGQGDMQERIQTEEKIIMGIYDLLRRYIPDLITGKGRLSNGKPDYQYDMWVAQTGALPGNVRKKCTGAGGCACNKGTGPCDWGAVCNSPTAPPRTAQGDYFDADCNPTCMFNPC